jgi:hypothetical protein
MVILIRSFKNGGISLNQKLENDLNKIKPGWSINSEKNEVTLHANTEADSGYEETGLEGNVPSNYENNLVGNPKGLTDFEVSKAPGRLG